MKRLSCFALFVLYAFFPLSLWAQDASPNAANAPNEGSKPYPVSVHKIEGTNYDGSVEYSGPVRPKRMTTIRSNNAGMVERILVKDGTAVRAGQPLLRVDSTLNQSRLRMSENAVRNALLEVFQQEIALKTAVLSFSSTVRQEENAKKQFEAEQNLYAQGYSSDALLNNSASQYETVYAKFYNEKLQLNDLDATTVLNLNIRSQVEEQLKNGRDLEFITIKNNLGRTYLPLDRAIVNFENAKISYAVAKNDYRMNQAFSPFSGTLLRSLVDLGQNVTVGTPLADFGDISTLLVDVYISPDDIAYLNTKKLPEVSATFDNLTEKLTIKGKLINLSAIADPQNRGYRATLEFPNPQSSIKIGDNAKVKLSVYDFQDQIIIPINAVLQDPSGPYVYVSVQNKAKRKPISLGKIFGTQAIVRSGLQRGDLLVIKGQQFIKAEDSLLIKP